LKHEETRFIYIPRPGYSFVFLMEPLLHIRPL
jgi:hypothetical protein